MEIRQKVYLKPTGNEARRSSEIKEDVISRVGRKYFETKNMGGRFFIDTMKKDGGKYISNYKAYLSKEEIQNEVELARLNDYLSNFFSYNNNKLSLDKLKQIEQIILE